MRLINIKTYEIEEFFSTQAPKYYALSHTWLAAGEEVSLKDWQTALRQAKAAPPPEPTESTHWIGQRMRECLDKSNKAKGFDKIAGCMRKASRDVGYCWVDTTCIDKNSSAELSEAINSMYRIYRECQLCIAYLADVRKIMPGRNLICHLQDHLVQSRWFTRGWTLQELIAPKVVVFYDRDWNRLGTTDETYVRSAIAMHTGIHGPFLRGGELSRASVAKRMSWAAKRYTTREEDMAYCLLGIFDINMPLLYGEGTKAFTRLQEEIIKKYDDDSIFAWASVKGSFPNGTYRSLLARSPSEFAGSGDVEFPYSKHSEPFSVTNKGLSVQFSGRMDPNTPTEFVVTLESSAKDPSVSYRDTTNVRIRLRKLFHHDSQYVRVDSHELVTPELDFQDDVVPAVHHVFVRDHPIISREHESSRYLGFCFDLRNWTIREVSPGGSIVSLEGRDPMLFVPFSVNFADQCSNRFSPEETDEWVSWLRFLVSRPINETSREEKVLIQFDKILNSEQTFRSQTMRSIEYSRENVEAAVYFELPEENEGIFDPESILPFPRTDLSIVPCLVNDELWLFADFPSWMTVL